jgi:hypothetical protein
MFIASRRSNRKEEFAAALRTHQVDVDETISPQREIAEEIQKRKY